MLSGVIVLVVVSVLAMIGIDVIRRAYPFVDVSLMRRMYAFHALLSIAYMAYVAFNPSDSLYYYYKVVVGFRGSEWMDFYGTSTPFIEWVGYPFIRFLGFSYEAIMVLFSFLGFVGFLFFYIFFKENIKFKHTVLGFDLLTLTFFLPNLHFWTSSFGKGSIIFMGLGLVFFGISKIGKRLPALIIGSLIVYHVRPHIMLVVLVSTAIGFTFSTRGVSPVLKVLVLLGATVGFFFIYREVFSLIEIDEEQFLSQGLDLTHRASELSKATSGIDISQYSLPVQVLTFLYRPLFFDAPGILGIIVSFENAFYVLMTFRLLRQFKGWLFIVTGNFLSKAAFLSFMTVSVALAQVSANLGLAMRQKSQVMILFMFVVISYMDAEKIKAYRLFLRGQVIRERLKKASEQTLA